MGSLRRGLVVALLGWAMGCGDDGAAPVADDGGTESTTSDDSTGGDSTLATTGPSTTSPSTEDSGPATQTTSETTPGTTGTDSTTGEPMNCGLTDDPEQTGPWFRMFVGGVELVEGGTIALECGGQGSLMFFVGTQQGGFLPVDETVIYSVTLDVPGFDELTPTGHFYQNLQYGLGVGCYGGDEFDGGFVLDGIAMFPPDGLAALTDVDGAAGTLHVELLPPDGDPIVEELPVVLAATQRAIESCGI